jgi:UDP-N-acetylmuramoyl-tripeptide--D-alanyl-D-alanine ligase
MHDRLKKVPTLIRTPMGRRELLFGLYYQSLPVLGRIAMAYRRTIARKTRVIAVTGSFGKTTTSRAIRQVLGLPLDPNIGVTQPSFKAREVLRIRPSDRYGVIETSIESPGDMAFAASFLRPDIAVVTAIGSEHLHAFGSIEGIRNEKADLLRILPSVGIAVLNGDDPNVLWMKGITRARVVTFGFDQSNDIYATDVSMDWPRGMRFVLHMGSEIRSMRILLIGKHMVYAALAAIAVGATERIDLDRIAAALEQLEPTPGRLQPVALANGAILLRDDFKSPIETIETAINVLAEIPAARRIVVLGQTSDAPARKARQRDLGGIVGRIASFAIFFGSNCQPYVTGARRAGMDRRAILDVGTNISLAIETLAPMLCDGDVVLIKGRVSEKLDRVALALMGRKVECTIGFCDAELRCSNCKMLETGWARHSLHAPRSRSGAP